VLLHAGPLVLEIHYLVCFLHLFIEELHVGQGEQVVFIHTVDGHTLASGVEYALAEREDLCLLCDGELVAVSLGQVHGRAIEEDGDVLFGFQKKIAIADSIPFDFRVGTGKSYEYLH